MLSTKSTTETTSARSGFTLIELMVSIVLVTIIMLAFSQVFRIATDTIVQTRGIANNDEKARTLSTLLKSDLETRTFRTVIPYEANEVAPVATDSDFELRDFDERKGYIYISDNDINNDTDDVLQLTIDRFISGQVTDTDLDNLMYGKALTFANSNALVDVLQPSGSDYQLDPLGSEGLTTSRYAEVSYFVRDGNLYRRVLLLYKPVEGTDNQPQFDAGGDIITADYDGTLDGLTGYATGDFWNDFDISAYHDGTKMVLNGVASGSGEDVLENDPAVSALSEPLSHPRTRFGFDYTSGLPREFIQESATPIYIGRFTHTETSHYNFTYPGVDTGSPLANTTLDDSDDNGIVDAFEATNPGPRQSEELLMSNVLSFDIKLWDEALNRFVDVGHSLSGGTFEYSSTSVRDNYSPLPSTYQGHIFDTWHPAIDLYDGTTSVNDDPPYRPVNGSDPVPIRAIQITLRYFDVQSDRTRQLTIQHSFID